MTAVITPPLRTNAEGEFSFYAPVGTYYYTVTPNGASQPVASYNFILSGANFGGAAVNPTISQTVNQPGITGLFINSLLPTSAPFKCVESFLSNADGHSGTDYGFAISAAVQASSLTSVTQLRVCMPGDHLVFSTAVLDRAISFQMDGQSRLIPQSSMKGTVFNINATASAGSTTVTMTSTANLAQGMACGGIGIQPGSYIVSPPSATTVTLSIPAKLEFYAVATGSSATLSGVSSMSGLAGGQTVTGQGANWPYSSGTATISSLNPAANTITLATPANRGSPVPDTFVIGGSWTTSLACVAQTPVLRWQYNMTANADPVPATPSLRNQYDYQIGGSMHDVWIADTANGGLGRSLPGVQGVQISGYDGFSSTNLRVDNLDGAGLILGGYVPGQTTNPDAAVRESGFDHDQIRNSGSAHTGQAALAIYTPFEKGIVSNDEINEISFSNGHYVCSAGVGVGLGSYNTGHQTIPGDGPRGIYFSSGFQIEGCPQGLFDTSAQSDSVYASSSGSIKLVNGGVAVPGQGKSLLHLNGGSSLSIVNTGLSNQGQMAVYTVNVTSRLNTVTYVSGPGLQRTFNNAQTWDGVGVLIGSTLMHLAGINPVASDGLSLQLASPWTGATGNQTMTIGYGGAFITSSDIDIFRLDAKGMQTAGNQAQTNALLGITNNDYLFEVGNNFDGSQGGLQSYDDFNGSVATVGPTRFRIGGTIDTIKPGLQATYDILGIGETDLINTNAGLAGGLCVFDGVNNYTPSTSKGCFLGVGGLAVPQITSGVLGNSDLNGNLTFAGDVAKTYTFADRSRSHNCAFTPTFDIGAGNRYWFTTAGKVSVTLHFATAVTGIVSYVCSGTGN
jgi:hypothetical protein